MGFISKFSLIKTLCWVPNWKIEDEEAIGSVQMDANPKKAMHFVNLIKQYQELALACLRFLFFYFFHFSVWTLGHFWTLNMTYQELALTVHDAGGFLGRRAKTIWKHGEGELSEWSEHKGHVLYQLAEYYEKRVLVALPLGGAARS